MKPEPASGSSEIDTILLTFYNKVAQDVLDNYHDGVVITKAHTDAKQAITEYVTAAVVAARLNEAFLIGVKHEKGEYLPATYLINRRDELKALTNGTDR